MLFENRVNKKERRKASVFNSIHEAVAFGISSHVWDSVRTHPEGINYPKLILPGPGLTALMGKSSPISISDEPLWPPQLSFIPAVSSLTFPFIIRRSGPQVT